ncbi:hypothetical protein YC2023_065149 [Brassica napus]
MLFWTGTVKLGSEETIQSGDGGRGGYNGERNGVDKEGPINVGYNRKGQWGYRYSDIPLARFSGEHYLIQSGKSGMKSQMEINHLSPFKCISKYRHPLAIELWSDILQEALYVYLHCVSASHLIFKDEELQKIMFMGFDTIDGF